jgi:hypothetical protein
MAFGAARKGTGQKQKNFAEKRKNSKQNANMEAKLEAMEKQNKIQSALISSDVNKIRELLEAQSAERGVCARKCAQRLTRCKGELE